MAGKQSSSKKRQTEQKKNARARCWATAQRAREANAKAQDVRERANRASDGMTPWQQALHARAVRRAILASAWSVNPWVPGRAADREKSVSQYLQSQKKAVPVAG